MIAPTNGHYPHRLRPNGRLPRLSIEMPPHDLEAEKAVLASLILDPSVRSEVAQVISPAEFYSPAHRVVWHALAEMARRGETPDPVLLSHELGPDGIAEIGGLAYLTEIIESVPTPANAVFYARIVKDHADRRAVIDAGRELLKLGNQSQCDADTRTAEARRIVLGLNAEPADTRGPCETLAYRPFPTHALPEAVRGLVTAGAAAIGCDAAYIALPLLSVLAAAIGNSRRIRLKRAWTEPAIVWTAIVGNSGTMKSPALDLALRPVRALQGKSFAFMGKTPPARYLTNDATIEAIAGLLAKQPRGILLAADELSGWLRSHDAYKSGRAGDTAKWLELHGGRALTIDRKSVERPVVYIPNASVSITGGIQPDILRSCLGHEHLADGLAARLLMGWPPSTVKRWREADVSEDTADCIDLVVQKLYWLEPELDAAGEPYPKPIGFSIEGKRAWVEWYNAFAEGQQGLAAELASAAAKIEGYAARLSLIVHCVRQVDDELPCDAPIDGASVAAGVAIAEWCWAEAQRIYAMLAESPAEAMRRELMEFVRAHGAEGITPNELKASSRRYRGAGAAREALDRLVADGFARWERRPAGPRGGRPSDVCVLNVSGPGTETAQNTAEDGVSVPGPPQAGADGTLQGPRVESGEI